MNDLQMTFQKERREFGKQCLFSDRKYLMVSLPSNHDEFNDYILRNPVSQGTQLGKSFSVSEANTESTTISHKGILHHEGGWPKDVNYLDPEQTLRYRRKIEKDEAYITQLPKMGEKIETCILQNNSVNIFEEYFEGLEPAPIVDRSSARTMYVYKDVESPTRPISHLSWSPDGGYKIAITYCDTNFRSSTRHLSTNSYIWETENPNQPLHKLTSLSPSICIEYQQKEKDINVLVSGQLNGQCCAWDVRAGCEPVSCTPREICHRESANRVLWINSKTGTEFFSGGADGQVIWWDMRKLNERLDFLYMDPEKSDEQVLERSYGVSVLEYETTIPTRFMVGSEQGMLFFCNRKGKTPLEKITLRMQCHASPIYTLARNPSFCKNFITVGDWNARIWSEDCKESSIIWTKYCSVDLTDGCWSPTKCSLFYLSRIDGNLEAWDLLQQQSEPILTMKISDHSIKCVKPHESGRMIACGCANGSVHLMEVSENMTFSAKNDKAILNAMLDREGKREKILEGKLREIRIKLKKQQEQQELLLRQAEKAAEEIKEEPQVKPQLNQLLIETAEREFYQSTEEEMQRRIKEQEKEEQDGIQGGKTKKKKKIVTENGGDHEKSEDDGSDLSDDDEEHENNDRNGVSPLTEDDKKKLVMFAYFLNIQIIKIDKVDTCLIIKGRSKLKSFNAVSDFAYKILPDIVKRCPIRARAVNYQNVTVISPEIIIFCEDEENNTNKTAREDSLLKSASVDDDIEVVYVNPQELYESDRSEQMMGVSLRDCDNGRVNLATDFDPYDEKEVESNTKCFDNKFWMGNNKTKSILTIMNAPRHYYPVHKCMKTTISYSQRIPTIGPHRPLWARYGEYQYCPPQRWLHNAEHGAIVGLYHPCADPIQVYQMKTLIKSCLFRHVITPYLNLTEERPLALVGWRVSLEMALFDSNLAKNFIKLYARTGPEKVFRDGQYSRLLTHKAEYVSNVIDSELCPNL